MSVYVGTAGWNLRAAHKALFGPGGSHLARYATRFNAVEINSSFYRPHRRTTYERWAATVPDNFRFAVKVPRTITQTVRLKDPSLLDGFLEQASGLGGKLGPLLVQLPPSLAFEEAAARNFFSALRERHAGPVACEPRHAGWFGPEAQSLLQKFHIARVAADPAPVAGAGRPGGWDGFAYVRWHGAPKIYYSDYSTEQLGKLKTQLGPGDWCIFDNTAEGAATSNALFVTAALPRL
jgi:uncharacterized protein YecE (DUF72 family)